MRGFHKISLFYLLMTFILLLICSSALGVNNNEDDFFQLYGVTLGKTTSDELALLGRKSDQYDYYIIHSLKFWFQKNIASSVQITKYESLPEHWENLGFNWNLSYDEWISLLRKLGFQVQIKKFPTVKIYNYQYVTYNPYLTFEAGFDAYKESEYPTVLNFSFNFAKGTKTTSEDSLYSITATYKPNTTVLPEQDFYDNTEPIILSEIKRKAIALSGILAELNKGRHESLATFDNTPTKIQRCKELLQRDWDIKNREDLLKTLDSLDKEGHSKRYQEAISILDEHPGLKIEELAFKYRYEDYIIKRLFFVQKMRPVIGERTLRAWDYGRSVYLCREGYLIGFLSEKEAWDRIDKIAKKIEKLYYSWEDWGANYIIGRMFWATSSNEEIEKGNEASVAFSKLIHTKNNAWNLPWNNDKKPKKGEPQPTSIEDALYCPSKEHRAWEYFMEGYKLYQSKLYDKAIVEFNNGLKLYPGFYYVALYRGHAYFAKGDYRQAITNYQQFLLAKPGDYYGSKYLAEAFEYNNQPDEALKNFEQTIKIDTGNPDGYISLGRFYFGQKQYQNAILTFEKAENLFVENQAKSDVTQNNSFHYTLYLTGASFYNLSFYDKALTYFLRAYDGYKTRGDFHYFIGMCYLKKINPEKGPAVEYFKKAEILGYNLPQEIKDLININNGQNP